MSAEAIDLGERVAVGLEASGRARAVHGASPTLLIAWSGGLDSTVLLDLVLHDARVRTVLANPRVVAAHLDHALRPESAADADAIARTARAWGVELVSERLAVPPEGEEGARDARYAFLDAAAESVGAEEIWTAHHADDQVETLLFRIARGTGLGGLAGIPARRGHLLRPFLLPEPAVGCAELEAHAAARALPVRPDATNDEPVASRNRIRHELLPLLEAIVPGAREALLRLARNGRRAGDEIDALAAWVTARGGFDAEAWGEASLPLRRALLRHAARSLGVSLSEAATEAALALPPDARSGRGVDLPGGLRFERVFDRWSLRRRSDAREPGAAPGDLPASVELTDPGPGRAEFALAARRIGVRWEARGAGVSPPVEADAGAGDARATATVIVPDLDALTWPLTLRGWRAGDRIRRSFGSIAIAKAWAADRVPRFERPLRWVLVDATGRVLAAEGLDAPARDRTLEAHASPARDPSLHLEISG
ncbi:MAG: tRNA lysidine(34) synthetase TilS [Longimicrobiales bacterium]|nr:tRNA lysidine(34) synthetase TilS [Longimicrobiales bacterium]